MLLREVDHKNCVPFSCKDTVARRGLFEVDSGSLSLINDGLLNGRDLLLNL